jgi:hypothetical protein
MSIDDYFERTNSTNADASDALRKVTPSEVSHYNDILGHPMLQDLDKFSSDKETHVCALLYLLHSHMDRIDEGQRPCLCL